MATMSNVIKKLMLHQNLTVDETSQAVGEILSGAAPEQVSAFLVLLHAKGETAEEMFGLVQAMIAKMNDVHVEGPVLDIVGTGGDAANTVNISTASSLLAAACGARVVKHGNRSVSSRCGSADVLEAMGVPLDHTAEQISQDLQHKRFAFCFSPNFHPAMRVLKQVRRALGVRTSFNLIGPLLNPAHAQHILMGVFNKDYLDLMSDTLLRLGIKHAMLVHSCGLDELSLLGPADVVEIVDNKKRTMTLDPKDFGFNYSELKDIKGGSVSENKAILENALNGYPGPVADTIVFNTAAALYVADIVPSIDAGVLLASSKIKTGEALQMVRARHA